MRTLAVSDMHFGAWTGDPVLARERALDAFESALEDVDELVLLGDVFDFLFSSVEYAFEQADPFFEIVRRRMAGRRVVFTAGNHDHHIVVRALRTAVEEKVATGSFQPRHPGFFHRFLERRLEDVETEIVYPTYRVGDVLLTHGHYLDAHIGGSFPNRLQARATRTVGGVNGHPSFDEQDYEAVIVPLTELLFTVAQMPRGCAVQMAFHHQFARIGKVLRHVHVRHGRGPDTLAAFQEVKRQLGWDAEKIVFAHTHHALDGVERDGVRYWNTGCWIDEAGSGAPGTAVLIDTDEPEPRLLNLLAGTRAAA
jgi:predicted phosphodiesterase